MTRSHKIMPKTLIQALLLIALFNLLHVKLEGHSNGRCREKAPPPSLSQPQPQAQPQAQQQPEPTDTTTRGLGSTELDATLPSENKDEAEPATAPQAQPPATPRSRRVPSTHTQAEGNANGGTGPQAERHILQMAQGIREVLIDVSQATKNSVLLPPGYFMTLGTAFLLAKEGSESKKALDKSLQQKNLAGTDIRNYNQALHSLSIKSTTAFLTNSKELRDQANKIFSDSGIPVVRNQAELNKAVSKATLDDKEIKWNRLLNASANDHVLLNVMSFSYDWLHSFGTTPPIDFHGGTNKVKATYQGTHSSFVTHKEPNRYMAVKLPFKNVNSDISRDVLWRLERGYAKDNTESEDAEARKARKQEWKDQKQSGIAAYLIGKTKEMEKLEPWTAKLLKDVHEKLSKEETNRTYLMFPSFRSKEASELEEPAKLGTLLPKNKADFPSIADGATLKVMQRAVLCVDDIGIQRQGKSEDYSWEWIIRWRAIRF